MLLLHPTHSIDIFVVIELFLRFNLLWNSCISQMFANLRSHQILLNYKSIKNTSTSVFYFGTKRSGEYFFKSIYSMEREKKYVSM